MPSILNNELKVELAISVFKHVIYFPQLHIFYDSKYIHVAKKGEQKQDHN